MGWGVDDERDWGAPGDTDRLWLYLLMPFMSGFIGYGTNVLALKMTFYPLEFLGVKIWQPKDQPLGLFGWQGIVPAKAEKMARISVKMMTRELIDVQEVFGQIDPEEFARQMEPCLLEMIDDLIRNVVARHLPRGLWDSLPDDIQNEIIIKTVDDAPAFLSTCLYKMRDRVENVLDLEHMVVTRLMANKQVMIDIFITVGMKEIKFIERSGFLFGFIFGVFQTILWYFYQENQWMVFYIGGFIVGFATNLIALKVIFGPIEEHVVCGVKFQGLFLKRQTEVSRVFAEQNVAHVLTPEAFFNEIFTGPKKDCFERMLEESMGSFLEGLIGRLKPIVLARCGNDMLINLKKAVTMKILNDLPKYIHHSYIYMEEALRLEDIIRMKMENLTCAKFERVLHPIFEEDEMTLILVGAALGFFVGVFQNAVMFPSE